MPSESKTGKKLICSHVSGEMPAKSRNHAISKLRNIRKEEVEILTNARCLSEGVDVPTLDGIVFMDPKRSQVDIIQALGRAIRKSEQKKDGYIILPVYLGDTKNIEDSILQSRFYDAWKVILALKSQDDILREELDQSRVELGYKGEQRGTPTVLSKIIFDLPNSISHKFSESLRTALVRETTENWMEMFGKLQEYVNTNGTVKVPREYPLLGNWVHTQRHYRLQNMLTSSQIKLLDSIDFIWDELENQWQECYEKLKQCIEENGDDLVPQSYPILGSWVGNQRSRKSSLSKKRIKLLESIGSH